MPDAVVIDPEQIRTLVLAAVFVVSGIELGLAFIMRGGHEASGDDL